MKHTTIYSLLFLAMMSIGLPSCKKWLDVQPYTQLPNEELFKTETGFSQALAGVYGGMTGTSLYGREMTFGALDVLAGYYSPNNIQTNTYYKLYSSFPYKRTNASRDDASVAIIDSMWIGMYNQVANLNNILEAIDAHQSVFTGDDYRIMKGEAIGLRAFLHLDLLRMYGSAYIVNPTASSIPFVDTLSSLVTPLLTVDSACGRIITELQKAMALMNNDPIKLGTSPSTALASGVSTTALSPYHNRRYHFNYYAVAATLARAYLWRGDKVNALKYAKLVLNDQSTRFPWVLDANLSSISSTTTTNKDRTFTTEHIFALNIRALENYIPNYFALGTIDQGLYLSTTSSMRTNIYEASWVSVDPRSQYLFTPNNANFFANKLYQDDIVSTWFKYQQPLIRITEMYYIAAECEPNVSDGLNWLNTVRTARKLSQLTSATITTSAALQAEIQKEYQKEFICEGQLWFYYKRFNLTKLLFNSSRMSNTAYYVFDMPDNEYLYGGRN